MVRPSGGKATMLSELIYQVMTDDEKRELHAVGDAELIENVGDVVLDGLFAEGKLVSDFLIAISRDNCCNDLHLAGGEAKVLPGIHGSGARQKTVEQMHDVGHIFAAYPILPFHHAMDTLNNKFRRRFLEHNSARAKLQGLGDFGLFDSRG